MRILVSIIISLFICGCQKKVAPVKQLTKEEASAAYMKASTPASEHGVLKAYVGKWNCAVKYWAYSGAEVVNDKGQSSNSLILGGRFLKEEYRSQNKKNPFTGLGITGFNTINGKYESFWIDTMSTAMTRSVGTYDPASKTMKWDGFRIDPLSGNGIPTRATMTFANGKYLYQMFEGAGKNEFKKLEITYTKAK